MRNLLLKGTVIAACAFLLHCPAAHAWGYGHGMLQVNPGTGTVTGLPNSGGAMTVSQSNPQAVTGQSAAVTYGTGMPASHAYENAGSSQGSQNLTDYYAAITKKNMQAAERESE